MLINLRKKHINFFIVLAFLLFSIGNVLAASKNSQLKVSNGPPPGFEDINSSEVIFVNVYYKNNFIATTKAIVENRKIKLYDVESIISKLPEIKEDRVEEVSLKLGSYSGFNTIYSCYPEKKDRCNMLPTDSIVVIYNPNIFTVEVVTNGDIFVKKEREESYLDPQSNNFSQFFKFNAIGYRKDVKRKLNASYPTGTMLSESKDNEKIYDIYLNSKTSLAGVTLNSDLNYISNKDNMFFDNNYIIKYFEKYSLQAGEFITSDLRSLSQASLLGVSFKSSLNRRRYNSEIFSSPLSVFLNYRSVVNIKKDGRMYSSKYYDSGNQKLITDELPSGSYNVEIEIVEPNGNKRTEYQFFSKNNQLPPDDQSFYWFEAGALQKMDTSFYVLWNNDNKMFNKYTNKYVFRGGTFQKISQDIGIGTNLVLNNDISAIETFLEQYGKIFNIRLSGAVDTQRDFSYTLYGDMTNSDKYSVYLNFTKSYLTKKNLNDYALVYRPIGSYNMQLGGGFKYFFGRNYNSIGLVGSYLKDGKKEEVYAFGPELEFNLNYINNLPTRVTLTGYKTDRDYQFLLNFYVNFSVKNLQLYHNSTYRANRDGVSDKNTQENYDNSTALTLQDGGIFDNNARMTARYDEFNKIGTTTGEAEYKSEYGRFLATASNNELVSQQTLNYSTIFAFNKDSLLFGGREPKDSAVSVKLDGGDKNTIYDIYVNQNRADYIKGNSTRIVPLSSFDEYKITLQPRDTNRSYLETIKSDVITLYPGSVETVKYEAKPSFVLIGYLNDKNGNPIKYKKVKGEIDETITDEEGYFQLTVLPGEEVKVLDYYNPINSIGKIKYKLVSSFEPIKKTIGLRDYSMFEIEKNLEKSIIFIDSVIPY